METSTRARPGGRLELTEPDVEIRVHLLAGFAVEVGGTEVSISHGSARVVAFLAVNGPAGREHVAGRLWPEATWAHAAANLRSALWRLPILGLVVADRHRLSLGPEVSVDLDEARRLASRWAAGQPLTTLHDLATDVLPDWYDEWLDGERELYRQLRLRSLEAGSRVALRAGRFDEAIEAGTLAVQAEPLRESAYRCVIAVQLAEGNRGDALHQYRHYLRMLDAAGLTAEPSPALAAQIEPVLAAAPHE